MYIKYVNFNFVLNMVILGDSIIKMYKGELLDYDKKYIIEIHINKNKMPNNTLEYMGLVIIILILCMRVTRNVVYYIMDTRTT